MAITRSVALNELPIRGLHVNSATASYTIVPSDSGIILFNDYATATTYTLPTVGDAAGKWFWIVNGDTATSTVVAATTACIKGAHATAYTTLTSVAVGDHVILTCDGTYYYIVSMGLLVWTLA